jgi:hypothetical protein
MGIMFGMVQKDELRITLLRCAEVLRGALPGSAQNTTKNRTVFEK